jgi:spore germination cell wall hydrolase CwlJ-like protein
MVNLKPAIAILAFVLVAGAAPAGTPKSGALSPAPLLTPEQQEMVALTHAVVRSTVSDAEQAKLINIGLPFSSAPVRAARPFSIAEAAAADRQRAEDCLTQAIYYEAGFEPLEGRRAVAQVILNRLRHPAFPKSVCGVIYEGASRPGCQFSFACDGALTRAPAPGPYREARAVARAALDGYVMSGVGQATHYHTDYVAPYWAPKLTKITKLGAHIFYRWPGGWGEPQAFNGRYAGFERAFTPEKTPLDAIAAVLQVAEAAPRPPVKVEDPTDRRAPDDVGGRIDPEKGWTLTIPLPTETRSSLSSIAAAQGET